MEQSDMQSFERVARQIIGVRSNIFIEIHEFEIVRIRTSYEVYEARFESGNWIISSGDVVMRYHKYTDAFGDWLKIVQQVAQGTRR